MINRIFIFLLLVLSPVLLFSQSATRADELFITQNYQQAGQLYEHLLAIYPQNSLYHQYRYARCLQETGDKEKAILAAFYQLF